MEDKRIFAGERVGMNLDVDEKLLPQGQTRARRNVMTNIKGSEFKLSNILGNTAITHTLPSGDNSVVGNFDDKNNEAYYALIWNGLGNHSVVQWKYNSTINTVIEIALGVGLAFDFTRLIKSVFVVDNAFLVWTDRANEIGCIRLNDYGSLPNPITADDRHLIELYKVPARTHPLCYYINDFTVNKNQLQGKLFKFRTRYVYKDNFRTHYSSISPNPVPYYVYLGLPEFASVSTNTPLVLDNVICVHIDKPEYSDVKSVEVLVQYGTNDDTMSDWYLAASIDNDQIDSDYGHTVRFDSLDGLTVVDQTEVLEPYSFLPPAPEALVFLPNNSILAANFEENMDADMTPLVELIAGYDTKPTSNPTAGPSAAYSNANTPTTGTYWNDNFNIQLEADSYDTITLSGTPSFGSRVVINIGLTYSDIPAGFSLPSTKTVALNYSVSLKDVMTGTAGQQRALIASNIARAINALDTTQSGFGGIYAYSDANVIRLIQGSNENNEPYATKPSTVVSSVSTSTSLIWDLAQYYAYPNFKRLTRKKVFIEYEDIKGRRTPAIPVGAVTFDSWDNTTNKGQTYFDAVIGHEPPADAVSYRILVQKNLNVFSQFFGLFKPRAASPTTFGAEWAIPDHTGDEYFYAEGDRIRFISLLLRTGAQSYLEDIVEYEILEYDATDGFIIDLTQGGTSAGVFSATNEMLGGYTGGMNFTSNSIQRTDAQDWEDFGYYIGMNILVQDANVGGNDGVHIITGITGDTLSFGSSPFTAGAGGVNAVINREFFGRVEVYRPLANVGGGFSYEIGQWNACANGLHEGNIQDQTASVAAITRISTAGDTYVIHKFDGYDGLLATGVTNSPTDQYVEFPWLTTLYESAVTAIGRPNAVDMISLQKTRRTTGMYHTQPYVAQTNLNGLSIALGSSFNDFAIGYGAIKFMRARDYVLLVWFDDRVGRTGINRELILLQNGEQTYQTEAVVNSMDYYGEDGGMSDASSHANDGVADYWIDAKRSRAYRLSQNGIFPISDYGVSKWLFENFDPKSNPISELNIVGCFDERHGNYVFSARYVREAEVSSSNTVGNDQFLNLQGAGFDEKPDQIISLIVFNGTNYYLFPLTSYTIGGSNEIDVVYTSSTILANTITTAWLVYEVDTLVFNEKTNSWDSFIDMDVEMLGTAGNDWVSCKDGVFYLQNRETTPAGAANRNTLFGENVESSVDMVFNANPSVMKIYTNIQTESNVVWDSDEDGDIATPSGQESNIIADDYTRFLPEQYSAPILRDVNTPNLTYPLVQGEDMRGHVLRVRLKNNNTSPAYLFAVTITSTESKLSSNQT